MIKKIIKGQKGFTLGELAVVLVLVIAMVGLSYPFLKQIIFRRDKVICTNNLRELGLALYIYAREHEGKFPPALKTLYEKDYLSDERLLDCPSTKKIGDLNDPDYIYTAGLSIKDPSKKKLVWDKAENHEGKGKNVLFLNGIVAWEE
jgi:hypothetical protein